MTYFVQNLLQRHERLRSFTRNIGNGHNSHWLLKSTNKWQRRVKNRNKTQSVQSNISSWKWENIERHELTDNWFSLWLLKEKHPTSATHVTCRECDQLPCWPIFWGIVGRQESVQARNPPWLWNPGQTSPEVQNRSISGPTKRTHVLQKFIKKRERSIPTYEQKHRPTNKPCSQWLPQRSNVQANYRTYKIYKKNTVFKVAPCKTSWK